MIVGKDIFTDKQYEETYGTVGLFVLLVSEDVLAKAMIVGKDIFTDKQYEETYGTGDMIPAPVVVNTEYQCIDLEDDGTLILMTKDGEMKEDLKLSDAGHLKTMAKEIKKIQDDGKKECLVRC